MNNDYSFSVASIEIIAALIAAFIAGAILCGLLRLIGRLFRGKPVERYEEAPVYQQTSSARPVATATADTDTNTTVKAVAAGKARKSKKTDSSKFQPAFPEKRPGPAPAPIAEPQAQQAAFSGHSGNQQINQLVDGNASSYEADIDSLLRGGASASQHDVSLPQHGQSDSSFANRAHESLQQQQPAAPQMHVPNGVAAAPQGHIDDLKKLEGIGPNIERLLNHYGVSSYAHLATLSRDQLRDILAAGGNEFQMHDPKSWPYQAELAAKQNWERLREYQEFLIEGRNR